MKRTAIRQASIAAEKQSDGLRQATTGSGDSPFRPNITCSTIGGLEKEEKTGNVSYDGNNHQRMINLRAKKVENISHDVPPQEVSGPPSGSLLVVSWGGTYGQCATAVRRCQELGLSVAHAHLRYLNPFPANLGRLAVRESAHSGVEQRPAPNADPGQVPASDGGFAQDDRQTVRHRRDCREDPTVGGLRAAAFARSRPLC